jgi:prepilin-type N-terminal cleavage/methylation domain-containing protein
MTKPEFRINDECRSPNDDRPAFAGLGIRISGLIRHSDFGLRISRGFTLVESMIAVVVLAISVTAIAGVLTASREYGSVTDDVVTAQELARQLMEEITAKPFADPDGPSALGPEVGETSKALFDNMDDYHGYADTTVRNPGNKRFARNVTCQYRATRTGAGTSVGDFLMASVTVKGPDGRVVTLSQVVTCAGTRKV